MDLFGLVMLSFPIFYIWGLISFIKLFTKRSQTPQQGSVSRDPDRQGYLKAAISELKNLRPDRTISDLLQDYKEELMKLSGVVVPQSSIKRDAESIASVGLSVNHAVSSQNAASIQNWYKDNSINLLLYIGAFLIIVSATIFAGLEGVVGVFKAEMISGLTILFLASGLYFSTLPKIKNAGSVFAGIGALLIPIAGIGWYKFVFEAMGWGVGVVWFITSLVGLFVYILLARYFKSVFYSYVTSLSSFSLSFALVNMSGLEKDFYLLASMMSSILLMGVSIYFKENKNESTELFLTPFNLSANIVMPVALFYGVILRLQSGDPFTIPTTASIFLGSLFYLLSYLNTKVPWHILVTLILSSLGIVYFGNLQHYNSFTVLLLLALTVYIDLFLVYLFQHSQKISESDFIAFYGVIKMGLVVIWAIGMGLQTISIICFCGLAIVVGVIMAFLKRNIYYSVFPSVITAVLLYFVVNKYFAYDSSPYILGMIYLLGGLGWYMATLYWKQNKEYVATFGSSVVIYFGLSTIFIADNFAYQVLNTLVIAGVCVSAARAFSNKGLIYLGNLFIAFATVSFVRLHEIKFEFYPLVFTALSYFYYMIGNMPGIRYKQEFRNTGLIGMFITPLFLGMLSFGAWGGGRDYNNNLERNALVSSYAAVIMYSLEAVLHMSSSLGYTASVIGVLTYMWQIHYLGVTNTLYYTLVLGLYFCVLAYLRRKAADQSLRQLFDVMGIGFFIFPTWVQSFGVNGVNYALLLGGIGVALLTFGITFARKAYKYGGILAIVLAVTSQSKWAIIGVAGLGFLGLALYLLLFRKETTSGEQRKN